MKVRLHMRFLMQLLSHFSMQVLTREAEKRVPGNVVAKSPLVYTCDKSCIGECDKNCIKNRMCQWAYTVIRAILCGEETRKLEKILNVFALLFLRWEKLVLNNLSRTIESWSEKEPLPFGEIQLNFRVLFAIFILKTLLRVSRKLWMWDN